MNPIKIIRIIIIVIAVVIVFFLVLNDFAFTGVLKFNTNLKKFTPFVSILVPQERTMIDDYANIRQEPVYFDISLPRDFDSINLEFEYFNTDNDLIEIGIQVDENNWDFQPLENQAISQIPWHYLQQGDLKLYQRNDDYTSVDHFFQKLPSIEQIGVYNYNLDYDYKIPEYKLENSVKNFKYQLQGPYQLYTYIKDEILFFNFELKAENNNLENTKVLVYNLNNIQIAEFEAKEANILVELDNLAEGAYKLELVTEPDIITENIQYKQRKLSFVNNIYLSDPATLISNSQDLTFMAYLNKGLQTIKINDQKKEILDIWQQYSFVPRLKTSIIEIPEGNLEIVGDGLLAFSQDEYFNPLPTKITSNLDLDNSDINYVLTYYNLPISKDGFKINTVSFDLNKGAIKKGQLRFVISVPNLINVNNGVYIKNLNIDLSRPAFWQENIKDNVINYLKYYKNEIVK